MSVASLSAGEIRTAVQLDRELIKFYEFTADVSDEGDPPRRSFTLVKVRVLLMLPLM